MAALGHNELISLLYQFQYKDHYKFCTWHDSRAVMAWAKFLVIWQPWGPVRGQETARIQQSMTHCPLGDVTPNLVTDTLIISFRLNATGLHWWNINTGWGNGLVLSGINLVTDVLIISTEIALRRMPQDFTDTELTLMVDWGNVLVLSDFESLLQPKLSKTYNIR